VTRRAGDPRALCPCWKQELTPPPLSGIDPPPSPNHPPGCRPPQDGKRLKGARNWCDVRALHQPALDPANGTLLPPGSLVFTLRVECFPGDKPSPTQASACSRGQPGVHAAAGVLPRPGKHGACVHTSCPPLRLPGV
jgi:hypothetical protein